MNTVIYPNEPKEMFLPQTNKESYTVREKEVHDSFDDTL